MNIEHFSPALAAVQKPSPLLNSHVGLLNELSPRCQVGVLFPNEQSVFNGLQKNFVNVGKGNLTFTHRDLLTVGCKPVVMAHLDFFRAVARSL